jgi:hypothetical protein
VITITTKDHHTFEFFEDQGGTEVKPWRSNTRAELANTQTGEDVEEEMNFTPASQAHDAVRRRRPQRWMPLFGVWNYAVSEKIRAAFQKAVRLEERLKWHAPSFIRAA